MREAMEKHRASPACASCHARMDPLGFAMENFDAVGRWRERDAGKSIDSGDGIPGLKKMLLERSDEFVFAVSEKLLMYAIGRNLQYYDAPAIREIVRSTAGSKHTFSALALAVAKSAPFQMRRSAG
jgi:Protein of unknown function (DUF1585)/Protein of unknown function (DUF1588)